MPSAGSSTATSPYTLTPGRQRGYLLHFADAKRPETRIARIDRAAPRIFEGMGMHD